MPEIITQELAFILERMYYFAPILGMIAFCNLVLAIAREYFQFRAVDRAIGYISESKKGALTAWNIFLIAVLYVFGIPYRFPVWFQKWDETRFPPADPDFSAPETLKQIIELPGARTFARIRIWISGPIKEELIFRAPLLILFSTCTFGAWVGIVVTSLIFGAWHFRAQIGIVSEIFLSTVMKRKSRVTNSVRWYSACFTFLLAALCGYSVIASQNIFVPIAIHIAWNVLMPTVLRFFAVGINIAYWKLDSALYPHFPNVIRSIRKYILLRRAKLAV